MDKREQTSALLEDSKLLQIKRELAAVRKEAVAAHISGNHSKAECLTGKAVGMKSTLAMVEKALDREPCNASIGELEGMREVIATLGPLPKCR